jgi:hypothetical protein
MARRAKENPMKSPSMVLVLVVAIGCDGRVLDVGSDTVGVGGTSGDVSTDGTLRGTSATSPLLDTQPICDSPVVDTPEGAWPNAQSCAAAATGTQAEFVGTWEGYSEDELFNPIKKYRLELLAASVGGPVCGTLKYGDAVVPIATNPRDWYPPAQNYNEAVGMGYLDPDVSGLLSGATYTILAGGVHDNRLRFRVSAYEHFRGWCSQQSSYYLPESQSHNCTPDGGFTFSGSGAGGFDSCTIDLTDNTSTDQFSIAQCTLCNWHATVCTCDSCHCTARNVETMLFDLTFVGDEATGPDGYLTANPTAAIPAFPRLRLRRVQ